MLLTAWKDSERLRISSCSSSSSSLPGSGTRRTRKTLNLERFLHPELQRGFKFLIGVLTVALAKKPLLKHTAAFQGSATKKKKEGKKKIRQSDAARHEAFRRGKDVPPCARQIKGSRACHGVMLACASVCVREILVFACYLSAAAQQQRQRQHGWKATS